MFCSQTQALLTMGTGLREPSSHPRVNLLRANLKIYAVFILRGTCFKVGANLSGHETEPLVWVSTNITNPKGTKSKVVFFPSASEWHGFIVTRSKTLISGKDG